ncbi:zinc finger MYM-type protein 1-like [Sitodiplosis mosellana]|uniref:zinc finger MYM-type protein 1-like n=1 Tax=Sitodiplosis mosellana TaxID=263140 RepID=UPI002444ADFB|nr:zinc finger MYM-type protein 1-like [Sitodiplosis mosellana]
MNRKDKLIKKKPSGAKFKRRRDEKEAETKKSTQSISLFLTKESSEVLPLEKSDVCLPNEKECEYRDDSQSESAILHSASSAFEFDVSMRDENEETSNGNADAIGSDISDIMNYPVNMSQTLLERIIRTGPVQVVIAFPTTNCRSFSESYYTKKMLNGDTVNREWLIYSKGLDSVHCFCCRLFQQNQVDTGFASINGTKDWRHLSTRIKEHELSTLHIQNYTKWKSFLSRISENKTIDSELFKQIQQEKERLKDVFKKIIAFVLFFARQNIAFTGSTSKLHDSSGRNGNFQQLVKTVATFDPVLREHIEREKNHYLSPKIQNELIAIIGAKVKTHILDCVKKSRYFSLILDSTTDITHVEQMTVVLRYVFENQATQRYEVRESFIEFLEMHEKTGLGIKEMAINELESLGLDPENLRGQGYDNGANMKGKNIGVQNLILEKYPRAFFVPCSSNRWDIMKSHITTASTLAPKNLCTTRWSSRIAAMKPLRLNLGKIIAALDEIKNSTAFKDKVRYEAGAIIDKIDYPFVCAVCMWYDVLSHVNIASKALQSIDSDLQAAVLCLGSTKFFLEEYRSTGPEKVFSEATEICESMEIEVVFTNSRKRVAVGREINLEESFQNDFIDVVLNVAINAVEERFVALEKHNSTFSFLYKFDDFDQNRRNGNLLKSCKQLQVTLSKGEECDIDVDEWISEMTVVAELV